MRRPTFFLSGLLLALISFLLLVGTSLATFANNTDSITYIPSTAATANNVPTHERPLFGFAVLSDLHVQAWDTESHNKLRTALMDLQNAAPEASAMIWNGDLTNGMPKDYATLTRLLKKLPHPPAFYAGIGNHEYYKAWTDASGGWSPDTFPNGETEQASIQRFLRFTGESHVYYQKMLQGYPLLFLGSERYRQSNPDHAEAAYLSAEQLSWLRHALKEASQSNANSTAAGIGKPIFVFLHQPLGLSVTGTECCLDHQAVVQDKELRSILSDYPQAILFTGHTHMQLELPGAVVRESFTMVNTSSVREPLTMNNTAGADASEGLYVEVYNHKVLIKGRDFHKHRWISQHVIEVTK